MVDKEMHITNDPICILKLLVERYGHNESTKQIRLCAYKTLGTTIFPVQCPRPGIDPSPMI